MKMLNTVRGACLALASLAWLGAEAAPWALPAPPWAGYGHVVPQQAPRYPIRPMNLPRWQGMAPGIAPGMASPMVAPPMARWPVGASPWSPRPLYQGYQWRPMPWGAMGPAQMARFDRPAQFQAPAYRGMPPWMAQRASLPRVQYAPGRVAPTPAGWGMPAWAPPRMAAAPMPTRVAPHPMGQWRFRPAEYPARSNPVTWRQTATPMARPAYPAATPVWGGGQPMPAWMRDSLAQGGPQGVPPRGYRFRDDPRTAPPALAATDDARPWRAAWGGRPDAGGTQWR